MIKDYSVLVKYNEIWSKIKKTLNIKFHSMRVYGQKYIKTKIMVQLIQTLGEINYQKKLCITLA